MEPTRLHHASVSHRRFRHSTLLHSLRDASDGVTHVVNNWDHFGGFLSGIFLAYYGLCPLFSSIQFKPGEEKSRAQRLNLEDKTLEEPFGKTSAILYGVCANLVAASVVVAFKRMSGVDDF